MKHSTFEAPHSSSSTRQMKARQKKMKDYEILFFLHEEEKIKKME
jgi:hypothetical protein